MRIFSIFAIREREGKGLGVKMVWFGLGWRYDWELVGKHRRIGRGGDNIALGNTKLKRKVLVGRKLPKT
jgi:hypothetical protein